RDPFALDAERELGVAEPAAHDVLGRRSARRARRGARGDGEPEQRRCARGSHHVRCTRERAGWIERWYLRDMSSSESPLVLIMAAGLGTRMKSDRAKVLHEIAGRSMIAWVVTAAREAGADRVVAILGHQHEQVSAALDARFGSGAVEVALQHEQ